MAVFAGRLCCSCQAIWFPVFISEAKRRGYLETNESLVIAQLIGGYVKSGGTHALGGAADWWQTHSGLVWLARQMGADPTWVRTRAQGFDPHVHSCLRGCPHGASAYGWQVAAVDRGGNGLGKGGMSARDDGPRPLSGRTWKQGLQWAQAQGGFMPALSTKQQREVHRWLREVVKDSRDVHRTLSPGGRLSDAIELTADNMPAQKGRKASNGVLAGMVADLHRTFSPGGQLRDHITTPAGAPDPKAIAAEVIAALPPMSQTDANAVADELALRLKS